ncbi:SagB/ThcOx family dehydrogenase [Devosia salina]|uniref:SagB/ThcOx family dehydrogenase n=1 Tax=Devosia salina TaxID=2860336 RepID=A0ABX8WF02_9HYPH|nr:SagB/ThcOx family dehydrogenase [Devosia salina]QYO76037.1 SagB/ThcOx family dehydrogenase [Devosia salina]
MHPFTRRTFLTGAAASVALAGAVARGEDVPTPGLSVREALARRQSIRVYGAQPVATDVLVDLLKAANGVNRPQSGGRTAPSWRGAMDVDIYVATADDVSRFNPAEGSLEVLRAGDIRALTSPQPFVGTAPVVLIYVSDQRRLIEAAGGDVSVEPDAEAAMQYRITAFVDTAVVAQNVYLYCAAAGLGTCLVGGNDPGQIAEALALETHQLVTYVQPVGRLP